MDENVVAFWANFGWTMFGVGMAILLALVGYFYNSSQEHRRWIRSERLKIYTEVLVHNERADHLIRLSKEERDERAPIEAEMQTVQHQHRRFIDKKDLSAEQLRERDGLSFRFSELSDFREASTDRSKSYLKQLQQLLLDFNPLSARMHLLAPKNTSQAFESYRSSSGQGDGPLALDHEAWKKFSKMARKDLGIGFFGN